MSHIRLGYGCSKCGSSDNVCVCGQCICAHHHTMAGPLCKDNERLFLVRGRWNNVTDREWVHTTHQVVGAGNDDPEDDLEDLFDELKSLRKKEESQEKKLVRQEKQIGGLQQQVGELQQQVEELKRQIAELTLVSVDAAEVKATDV